MPAKPPRSVAMPFPPPDATTFRSAPAQKYGPLCVMTPTHNWSSSSRRSMAASMAALVSALMALRASGRSSRITNTRPCTSVVKPIDAPSPRSTAHYGNERLVGAVRGEAVHTPICDQLGIEFPIFAFSHCRDVVAAVTNAGGFGVLGALAYEPERLEIELNWIDEHVKGKPYGVD